jgi:hypothetical protein
MKKLFLPLNIIIFLILFYFATLGNDCQNLIGTTGGSITGKWELVKMEGNLQDVCLGEIAEFQASNQATLTCPGNTPITRGYSYTNNILTYTTSNISYNVSFMTENGVYKMILVGNGIERQLTYDQIN